MASLLTQIKVRKDTYDNIKDLVLAQGEPGFAHDTGDYAVGNGTNKFSDICFSLQKGVINNGTSTDNAIARFDGATGRIIQNSEVLIQDNGALKTVENKMGLQVRTHTSYEGGWVYGTSGNESLTLALQNPVTAFQIVYGTKPSAFGTSTWQTVTPLFQTKDGKVIINRKIAATADAANLKLLDVNGTLGVSDQITSTVAQGTAPFVVASTTLNTNLNADLLDGKHASEFQPAGDYVTGPSSATDNAIARYDGATGKIIQNSTALIDDTGNLTLNNASGGNLSVELKRGDNADWRILSQGGNLLFQNNWTSSKGSYFDVLSLAYNSGNITVNKGSLTSTGGFIHGNLTAASGKTKNDYVLLAGGGSKLLTDITYELPLATSTVRGGLKVGYTSTQDNLALTLSTATGSAEQAYVTLPSRLYGGNTTATTNPTHSGYYFYKDVSDAGKVFNDTAESRQAATWVSAYDGSWAGQIGVGYYKDVIAYRRKQGSTTWGSWIELADKQWVKDQGYLTAIPSRLGPNTNGNNKSPDSNHTSGWAYYSGTAGTNGLPANVSDAEYLTLGYNDSTWAHQLLFKFNGGGVTGTAYDGKDLYTRIYNQTAGKWSDWYTILTSGNVTSILNDKYVTIDTAQDITGTKTYKAPIKTTAACLGEESSSLQYVLGIKAFNAGGDMLWQNAGDFVWNNIPKKNVTTISHSGWTSQDTDAKLIPTMNMIAYWNGAYNSSNNSNLKYSTNGEIVGGSSLTADKIVVGNGNAKIKTSSKGIVSSITSTDDDNLPTSKAVAEYVAGYSGGHYSHLNDIGSNNGYFKITIKSRESWMLAFTVRTYQSYTFTDYHISGYNYSRTSPYTWYSPEVFLISEKGGDNKVVYFGHQNENVSTGYRTLWVAIPAGNYSGIDIIDVTNGYTQISKNDLFAIEYIALGNPVDTSKLGGVLTNTVTARRQAFVDEITGDTTYGADRGISLSNGNFGHSNTAITAQASKGLYKISYDAYGHITGTESYTDQNTTYTFAGGTDGFTVTPSGGTAQTIGVRPRFISSPDTRSTAIGPDGISAGIQFDFKSGATVSHPTTAVNKYVGVMTWKAYGGSTDYSGGGPLQLSYDEAGALWTRLGSRTAWGDWHQLATQDWVTEQIEGGGSGSNSEYAKFLKPQDSATSDGASTWKGSAVADTWKRGWSQRFKHTGIGSDTGDINFWLRPAAYSSGGTELCIMIDGDFYGHTGSKRVAYTDELPSVSNKQITIQASGKGLSGTNSFTLNQNSDKTITLTLDSSASGNRTAEKVVIAAADGQIDSMKYAITNDSGTVKASWQYNASTDCVELVWA